MNVVTAVGTLIIVIVVLIATLAMLFMLFRFLRSDKGPCAPIREDQVEVRAVVQIAGTTIAGPSIAASSGLPSAYAVAFAVPPAASSVQSGITVNATQIHPQVPSARATLVNSAEASIYETATAVVAGNAV